MEIFTTFTDDMPSVIIESKLQMFLKLTTKVRVAASFIKINSLSNSFELRAMANNNTLTESRFKYLFHLILCSCKFTFKIQDKTPGNLMKNDGKA